jgi:hypothetical protein
MKRQRGRNRGGGGGGKPQQNANRAFDSNGPEGIKVRGNAQHVFEKYQQLARDATSSGDRVLAENYLQHAEHYFRLLRAIQPQRPASEILGRDQFASGYDIDFEDESGTPQVVEGGDFGETAEDGGAEARDRGGWQDRPREDRRDERPRDERPREDRDRRDRDRGRDRWRDRDDRPRDRDRDRDDRPRGERDDRPRDDRPREDRSRDDRPRDERPRDDRPRDDRRDDRPRGERGDDRDRRDRFERQDREDRGGDRSERDPLAVVEPQAAAPLGGAEGRGSPVLRDAEGGESHAPAFLQSPTPRREAASDEEGAAPRKPRRRRTPRSFDGDAGASPSGETEEA